MTFTIDPYVFGAGGGATTPSSITSIWEWWEPSREGLSNNDPIITLTGQVSPGTGHNWGQATSTSRPTYLSNQINGLGVAHFDITGGAGGADWMDGVNPHALTAVHFFIVMKMPSDPPGTSQIAWAFGTDTSNPDAVPFTDSTIYAGPFSNARKTPGNPTPSLAAWRVYEVVSTSSEWTWRIDGATTGAGVFFTTATNSVAILTNCVLGADANGANWKNEDIAGIYIFSAKLSSGDRTTMVNYLNTRFGLSIS